MLNPRKSQPSSRCTMRVLSSLKTNPRGASHAASRALTCCACSREWHRASRSSAYLTKTGESGLAVPALLPLGMYRTPAACSIPCKATFSSTGLITPPCGLPRSVGAHRPWSITPACNQATILPLAGNDPSWPSRWAWSIWSNAAARSASSAHCRRQVAPRAVTKMACIASWQPRPGRNPYDRDSNRASHSGSSAPTVRACNALSAITGIPSPRRFPFALGINTRLTGLGLHAVASCWSQSASSAFSPAPSTTLPSTPAVLRPAFRSVTRRTLSNAFARERSISFCRLRTFFRSPAWVAVKIRCRSRRTSSSTRRQSTASQSKTSPSGPFTIAVSNLPIGSSVFVHQVSTGSPDPRQLPFRPGIRPYPTSSPGPIRRRCRPCGPRFPAAFRPSALACWVILRPLGSCTFLTVGLPDHHPASGPQRGCRVAHEQATTGQDAPLTPGTVVRSQPAITLRPAPAALLRPVPTAPLKHPIGGGHLHEASSGVHLRSPITPGRLDAAQGREASWLPAGLLLACDPRMEQEPLGL